MKAFPHLPTLVAVALALPLFAPSTAYAVNGCAWDASSPGPMTFVHRFGTIYVPRDAPMGAVIGIDANRVFHVPEGGQGKVYCTYEAGQPPPEFKADPIVPLASPPANSGGQYDPDRLLQTDVPGIAVQMEYDSILGNGQYSSFRTIDGSRAIPPMHSEMRTPNIFPTEYAGGYAWFTVVKTGPLAAGPHVITARPLFTGSFSDIGQALTYAVEGTVIVAQCDIGATAPIEVDLGEWDQSHFSSPGTTTPEVPVRLQLHNCQDDPGGSVATVHAQFKPQNGSVPIGDPADGLFSMTTNATAAGVGIRLLKDDGNPMPLDTEVAMGQVPANGASLDLNFAAQLYQVSPSAQVEPGSVEGMLEFTLSYQ